MPAAELLVDGDLSMIKHVKMPNALSGFMTVPSLIAADDAACYVRTCKEVAAFRQREQEIPEGL